VSPSAFFHHFASLERFTDALMVELYSHERLPRGINVRRDLEAVSQDDLPVNALFAAYRHALIQNLDDPEYRLKLGLWAIGGADADLYYRKYTDTVAQSVVVGAHHLLESWGREPRPPFDLEGLVAVGNALTQGAYIRHVIDPELLSVDRYVQAIIGTVLVGIRLKGDTRSMADRLAEMNYYPRKAASPAGLTSSTDGGATERLVNAAAELFAEYGFESTSVSQLAKRAKVSTSTLFNLFGTKAQLAIVLYERYSELHLETWNGWAEVDNPILDYLICLAALAERYVDLTTVFLALLAVDDTGRIGRRLVDPLGALLLEHGGGDLFVEEGEDHEAAQMLTTMVMHRMLRRPGLGVEAAARWASRFLAYPAE
jgi:AcrR family transcriptional regulator